MDVRERVLKGYGVRVLPLAKASGFPPSTLYDAITAGKIEHVRLGKRVVVTAEAARKLMGMADPAEKAAA